MRYCCLSSFSSSKFNRGLEQLTWLVQRNEHRVYKEKLHEDKLPSVNHSTQWFQELYSSSILVQIFSVLPYLTSCLNTQNSNPCFGVLLKLTDEVNPLCRGNTPIYSDVASLEHQNRDQMTSSGSGFRPSPSLSPSKNRKRTVLFLSWGSEYISTLLPFDLKLSLLSREV